MRLLEKTLHLTPKEERTNIILPFTVPQDFDRLEFCFSYGPKLVDNPKLLMEKLELCMERYVRPQDRPAVIDPKDFDPLVNFVTLSVDQGTEYVGCAHRHPPEQTIVIGERESTAGFYRVPVKAGPWRAVLNVHAVAEGEVVYHLTIDGKEAGE